MPDDDPAELLHEASGDKRHYRLRDGADISELEYDRELVDIVDHAGKRHRHLPTRELPPPRIPAVGVGTAIERRRTERAFGTGEISEVELSGLLYAAYGEVTQSGDGPRRTVPSAGALFPLDVYLVCERVENVAPGLYRYEPTTHAIESLDPDLSLAAVARTLVRGEAAESAACAIVAAAMFWRTRSKFGLRGYRFALMEAGHVMQNLLLASTALDLGAAPLGGFYDQELSAILGMDSVTEAPLYLAAVGRLTSSGGDAPRVG